MKSNLQNMIHALQFPYQEQGQVQFLTIHQFEDWFSVNPVTNLLGLNPARSFNTIQAQYEHTFHSVGRGRPPMFLKLSDIEHFLTHLTTRNKQSLLHHLRDHLIPFLQAELRQAPPAMERVFLDTDYKPEYVSEEQALQNLKAYHRQNQTPIYVDHEWDETDRLRLKINQLGVTEWEDVNYLALTYAGLILLRLPRTDSPEPYEEWRIPIHSSRQYTADFLRGNGWDLAPVFYLKYPFLYERKLQTHIRGEFSPDMKTGRNVIAYMGKGAAPWYSARFESRILRRRFEIEDMWEEQMKQERERKRRHWMAHFTLLKQQMEQGDHA